MLARKRSARTRLLRIVRARPEKVTSTVVSDGQRGRLAQLPEAGAHPLVVGLIVAPDHEPGDGPVRDDVGRRAALADDPVDAGRRSQLLAPQADRGEQQDHRVQRVPAAPRIGRGMRLQAAEHDVDVLRGERIALHVRPVARVVEQRGVDAVEQAVVDHDLLAAAPLLGRRPEEHDLAGQLVGERGQRDRRTRPPRRPSCCGRSRARDRAARRTRRGSRCAGRRPRGHPGASLGSRSRASPPGASTA